MTAKMAALQPEEIAVDAKESSREMGEQSEAADGGPASPDGVDGLHADEECESEEEESGSDEEEEDEDTQGEEMPDGDTNADLHALLAFSKSRLEKAASTEAEPAAEPTQADADEGEASDEDKSEKVADDTEGHADEKKMDADAEASGEGEEPAVKDQAYYIELAMKKTREAEEKAKNDEDPASLLKLAEKKVAEAEAKAREDEEAMGEVSKPALSAQPTRSENSELWALLNYSKMRLETGSTPQVGKKSGSKAGSKSGSVRGDDNMSVSSKLSKASKRSLGSKRSATAPVTVVGGPGNLAASPLEKPPSENGQNADQVPFPDVTDDGEASVDGSVSLESRRNSVANEDESESDEDEEESSEEESEEEGDDDLPDFLKDEQDAIDPEEARALYEAAKFKAASILSVSEEKLTDVQMLQAIAIAEEAARTGEDKFSTKRSLFKLNEAKVEDLKSFLNLGMNKSEPSDANQQTEREAVGWGIGGGRLKKKLGSVFSDFSQRCQEIDEKKMKEREGQPTTKEVMSAAMLDLKAQIDEYEKTVKSLKKT